MSKDRTTSKESNEFETNYHDRFRKIREAAATAIKELSLFRSAGLEWNIRSGKTVWINEHSQ
jgi:hypothetical protein